MPGSSKQFEKVVVLSPDVIQDAETRYLHYWQIWHHNWDDGDIAHIRRVCALDGKRVLEIGCGDGRVAYSLAPPCLELTAIDTHRRLVEIAISRLETSGLSNLAFSTMDAQALSFADNSFDVVLMPWVLQMVDDPGQAVNEAFRVLKSKGELIVVGLLSTADYDRIIGAFVRNMKSIDPRTLYEAPIESHFGRFDKTEETFNYFFASPQIAIDAFSFALEQWYSTPVGDTERERLSELLNDYRCSEHVRIAFPANVYTAVKP